MPRIRTVKPDFFADEKLAKLKHGARLLYIGLWVFADDYGTVRSNPTWIKSNVFPYDEELRVNELKTWLDALVKARMLEPFTYNDEGFYNIRTFDAHQKVEKKSKPSVPIDEKLRILKTVGEYSGSSRGVVGEDSPPEVVHSTEDIVREIGSNTAASQPIASDDEIKFKKFQEWILKNAPNVSKMKDPFTLDQYTNLKSDHDMKRITSVLEAMHNWAPLLKKNISAYKTVRDWYKRDNMSPEKSETKDPMASRLAKDEKIRKEVYGD